MHVRETDLSVFPTHTQLDLRRQQQDAFEQMHGKMNAAVLDKHFRPFQRTMTDGERLGFTRCNGNIIAPGDIPYKPWQPKEYHTKEHYQKHPEAFGENERRKAEEAAKMMQSKDYSTNFTKQPPLPHGKSTTTLSPARMWEGNPRHQQQLQQPFGPISGFNGMGYLSPDFVHGKAQGELCPAPKNPPWLQDDGNTSKSRQRFNPSMYSNGVSGLLGLGHNNAHVGPSSLIGASHQSSVEKGAAYPTQKPHKKIYYVPDSTGGHASPYGAKMPSREEGTTSQAAYYHPQRVEALSYGRAHTSMLP
jgi:hypothetical protein